MIIEQSSMLMASRHEAWQSHSTSESLHFWVDGKVPDTVLPSTNTLANVPVATTDPVTISPEALAAQADSSQLEATSEDAPLETDLNPKLEVLKALLEKLSGRKIGWFTNSNLEKHLDRLEEKSLVGGAQRGQGAGFGLEYDRVERYIEIESMQFAAEGIIKTADGKEIEITLDLSMSRSYMEENSISVRAGDALLKDPLVINFNGAAAQLTQTRFEFDLDSDGQTEQMPFVTADSGLLALDRNGDGKINDGSELFGPSTGDSMTELADLDDDGNRWIDEKDSAFSQLRVWTKDAEGTDQLQSLKTAGVGAIYLDSVDTPFALKDNQNALKGQIRSTGIYLSENAMPGTIQQLDLAV